MNTISALARTAAYFGGKKEPTWEIAELYPPQGDWTEEEYLRLDTERRIELNNGCLEFLSMPKTLHKFIELFLYHALLGFVENRTLGVVTDSGLKVRLKSGLIRLPDVVFVSREHAGEIDEDCANRADLVMEVVSPSHDDRERDYFEKVRDYAKAGIREYWIVDPQETVIKVLKLDGKKYAVHGEFKPGQKATSVLLKGFSVDVKEALAGLKQ